MKVKLKNTYKIWVKKEFETEIEVELLEYLEDCGIESEGDLIESIYDSILWNDDLDLNITNADDNNFLIEDDDDNIIITNIDEIVEKYRYLIKEESCCDKNNYKGFTYCPECGKKLK